MTGTPYGQVIDAYSTDAAALAQKYNRYDRSAMFHGLGRVLVPAVRRVLDIGAGNGIDARRFADTGRAVTAVEPSDLIDIAQVQNAHPRITWIRDSLPYLSALAGQEGSFDLVFLNRVFMHVPPDDQTRVIGRLLDFLAPQGFAYLVIRHGPSGDNRQMFPVDLGQIRQISEVRGMVFEQLALVPDYEGRPDISWSFSLITRP